MSLRLSLPRTSVEVPAGQSVLVDLSVTNTGTSTRRFRLEVTGRAASWVHLTTESPAQPLDRDRVDTLALAAGASATLALLVAPPRTSALSEQMVPFTVRALDPDRQGAIATTTGLVVVHSPATVTASLAPQSVAGRRGSRHVLHLATDDPAGVLVTLRAVATGRRTRVTVAPVATRVEPGRPAQADVTVEAAPTVLRRRRHGFEIVWETEGPGGPVRGDVKGTFAQLPVLPPMAAVVLGIALTVALALAGWQVWPSLAGRQQPVRTEAGRVQQTEPASSALAPPFVIVDVHLKERAGSLQDAQESAARAPVEDGQRSRVVDGADDPDLDAEFWVVVVEGFRDLPAAQAYCADKPPLECSVVE